MKATTLLLAVVALRLAFLAAVLWMFLDHGIGWGWWLLVLLLTAGDLSFKESKT